MVTVSILTVATVKAVENKCFSLTQRVGILMHDADILRELAAPSKKEFCLQAFKSLIQHPEYYYNPIWRAQSTSILKSMHDIYALVSENIAWKTIKHFNLEDDKITLTQAKEYADANRGVVSLLEKNYTAAFKQKLDNISSEEFEIITLSAVKEAASVLFVAFNGIQSVSLLGNIAPIAVVKLAQDNKDAAMAAVRNMYDAEGCGICRKTGADVFWFTPYSRGAHNACYALIKEIESDIDVLITNKFKDESDFGKLHGAHVAVVAAVQHACGNNSLKEFLINNGTDALKSLFNTVGKEAFMHYCQQSNL